MRVLLVVQHVENLFRAGIAQQVYFTRLALLDCGLAVDVAALNAPVPAYRAIGIETEALQTDTDPSRWRLIVFVSTAMDHGDAACRAFLERAKRAGTRLVYMLCGNYFYLLQEQLLFKSHAAHELGRSLLNPLVDEYWLLETYRSQRSFMEALLGRPVRIAPYCWSADVIDAFMRERGLRPHPAGAGTGAGVRVLIAEPNASVHKSALLPLLIADGLRRARPDLADFRVLLLSGRKLDHDLLAPFLRLYGDGILEIYPRLWVLEALHELGAKGHRVLFLSHQLANGLNFLHFEALALGHAFVHNSAELRETGFFYPGEDVESGVRAAQLALREDAAGMVSRSNRERGILAAYHPTSARVLEGYRELLAWIG